MSCAAGNGAAMRAAPLAFLLEPTDPSDLRTIRDVSRITHHNDEAYTGALSVVAAVRCAWRGEGCGWPDLLRNVAGVLPDSRIRDRLREIIGMDPIVSLAELAQQIGTSGYATESVPLALCGAQRVQSTGFQGMMEELISLGGDTDTIASMAGQVAGTILGYDALPPLLVSRLPEQVILQTIVKNFLPDCTALMIGHNQ